MTRTFLATITRTSILLAVLVGQVASAEVKPNALFSDGAVLQQGMKVPMWGTASSGEMVSVTFQHQVVSTVARDGKWMVWLSPLRPGGPYTLKIAGENSIELTNIMVGEVWVCSGQSNMWFRLGAAANGREAATASADPMLRLYTVPQAHAFERKGVFHAGSVSIRDLDVEGKWRQSGPDTVPKFSAVGYFFGRDLRKALKVPVGLINAAIGSSYVEEWIPRPVLEDVPELRQAIEASGYHETGGLYNDMIKPIIPYAIRGVIWYQGENNASEGSIWDGGSSGKMTNLRINERGTEKGAVAKGAYQYRSTFPIMIRNWREEWKEGNFPFLFVQLPPFYQHDPTSSSRPEISPAPQEGTWAELRESQLLSMMHVRRTAMVVTTDFGDTNDIHPKQKEPVGSRLALAARAIAYGERLEYSGPIYKSMKVKGDRIVLTFDRTDSGLTASDGDLRGFTITGEDRTFVAAEARIDGNKVVVWSPSVQRPVAVRYGWANYPVVNLFNKSGLPASPFRTDNFPLVTGPR